MEPDRKPNVIYADNSLEFGKACEDLSWNHCTSTPHRSETNGIAERAVRRIKEGTSAVFLQRGDISQRKWKFYFSSRRWTNQTCWRRSGTENIHLDTGTSNSRRNSRRFSWRIRSFFHHLTTRFRMPVKQLMISGPCQETSFTAITLNQE